MSYDNINRGVTISGASYEHHICYINPNTNKDDRHLIDYIERNGWQIDIDAIDCKAVIGVNDYFFWIRDKDSYSKVFFTGFVDEYNKLSKEDTDRLDSLLDRPMTKGVYINKNFYPNDRLYKVTPLLLDFLNKKSLRDLPKETHLSEEDINLFNVLHGVNLYEYV